MMHDEDAKYFSTQALPVNELVPVDMSREPINGHEYLLRARLEAAKVLGGSSDAAPPREPPVNKDRQVEGNEHILRTRLEAVAAAERTLKKVGMISSSCVELSRKQDRSANERKSMRNGGGGEMKMKQDGQKNKKKMKQKLQSTEIRITNGEGDDDKVRQDGQGDGNKVRQSGQRNDIRTKDNQKGESTTKQNGRKDRVDEGRRKPPSECFESENLFLRMHDELVKNKNELQKKFPKKPLPLEDKKSCCLFCLGSESFRRIYKKRVKKHSGHPPRLSYVVHLDEEEVLLLLQYFYEWYLNVGMNDAIARWLYALLACLERPISKEQAFGMLESFYLSCCKGRCEDLEYPYQCFVESLMQKLSNDED